ncbi:insulinase family protein [Candidatus Parcubacteria bacterium]|nr:insulinase family protein [Candidatus Parcubacteria bacterium]
MKYKKKILLNGLRVVTIHMADTPTVTVLVMVEAGSEYETKEKNGISHFLEHMCFKGTEKRPTALAITKELDAIGAHYNAFTSEEYTGYYAKSAPKHLETIFDVISDLYLNQTFPVQEIEKEKGVIVEEINMYKDLPHRHVQELFTTLLYGNQPAGWSITGTRETVLAMKRDDFINYRKKFYTPAATTVIVAGNFDEKKINKQIQITFGSLQKNKKEKKPKVIEKQNGPQIVVENRTTDQSHLVLGVRGFHLTHPQTPIMRVLNAVLGAGMSSRLFQKLREEMGVGYYVRSSHDAYVDHGIFSVSVGSDVKRVEEVIKAVIEELNRLKKELVPADELKKTKDHLTGTLALGLESSDSIAEFYGYQESLRHEIKTPKDIVQEIQSITAEQIRNIAQKIFIDKNLNLAIVGPVQNQGKIKEILKF